MFLERVTVMQPGSFITLPDDTRISGKLLRRWVVEPSGPYRPTVVEVLAAVEQAIPNVRAGLTIGTSRL